MFSGVARDGRSSTSIDDEFELKGDLDKPILLQNIVHLYASTQSVKNHKHCCHIMPSEDQAVEDAKTTAISYATDWGSKLTPYFLYFLPPSPPYAFPHL